MHGVNQPQHCDEVQGKAWLAKYISAEAVLCGNKEESPESSSVVCYGYPLKNRGLACVTTNMVLDTNSFMGSAVAFGQTDHQRYLPAGNSNSVQLSCSISRDAAFQNLVHDQLPWFKQAKSVISAAQIQTSCLHAVQHPVMFVSRLDPTNPYHHTQTLVQTFLSLAVVAQNTTYDQLQVIIADHFAAGPFIEIWNRLSRPHPVVKLPSNKFAEPTCFAKSIQAQYCSPGESFLGLEGIGVERTCPSLLLMAFAHWQRHLFQELLPMPEQLEYQKLGGLEAKLTGVQNSILHRRLNVVWLSRQWFGKGMRAGGGLTGWQAQRQLAYDIEKKAILAMQEAVADWNNAACAPPVFGWWQQPKVVPPQQGCKQTNVSFDFHVSTSASHVFSYKPQLTNRIKQAIELSVLDLSPDQVLLLTRTAVLIGTHGAALTNQIWMRPHRGAVVEVFHGGNYHYRNMAFELGHKHFMAHGYNGAELKSLTMQAMDHVAGRYE